MKTSKAGLAKPTTKVTFLGTGTSTGIPIPTCQCETCGSQNPKDKRLRCSCLIEIDGLSLVIDTGPDFREQALRAKIDQIDAVLYTHAHFDHVAGLCDLRPYLFRNRKPIPCFASKSVASEIRRVYDFIFVDRSYPGVPNLELREIDGAFTAASREDESKIVRIESLEVMHGNLPILGFRIGDFAYITDASLIPKSTLEKLKGVRKLALGALRWESHKTHFSISEAVELASGLGVEETYFIHMTHSILHDRDSEELPEGFQFAHDGLVVEV